MEKKRKKDTHAHTARHGTERIETERGNRGQTEKSSEIKIMRGSLKNEKMRNKKDMISRCDVEKEK